MVKKRKASKRLNTSTDLIKPSCKRRRRINSVPPDKPQGCVESSDDELPPAFGVTEEDEEDFKVNDLVWAKWKNVHWPAVIVKLNVKQKKIGVLFVDSVDVPQLYWLRTANALHYGGSKRSNKLRHRQCKDAKLMATLSDCIKMTDDYLQKQLLNICNTDPIDFFRFPTLYLTRQRTPEDAAPNNILPNAVSGGDDREADESSSSTEQGCPDPAAAKAEPEAPLSDSHKAKLEELIVAIKSSECKEHLSSILSGGSRNRRHKMFFSNRKSKRRTLRFRSGFGPFVEDDEHVATIFSHLKDLLSNSTSKPYSFDPVAYVFDVWVPEAIIFALKEVFGFSLNKAKNVFMGGQSIVDIMGKR